MINFQKVIDYIRTTIKRNGKREITGDLLQANLLSMVDVNQESYLENHDTILAKETESIARDEALGRRIDEEGGDLTALEGRVTKNEGDIVDLKAHDKEQDTRIDGLVQDTTDIKAKDAEQDSRLDAIEAKDVEQDTKLDGIATDLTDIKARVAVNEGDIADHETRITDNTTKSTRNESEIVRVEGKVDSNKRETDAAINELSGDIAGIKEKDIQQDSDIRNLKNTTQIKDLDVEVRNTGFGWVSSESASEIYAHAIKGGNVKIQINDKKYTFVEYRQRTAYFRTISVSADKVTEDSIEIYEKEATFKTIEYKAVFDATPLLTSFQRQEPLTMDFISALDEALGERKLVFVSGNGTIYLLISTSKTSTKRTFTGVGENEVYVLSYGANRIVNLETYTIGGDIHIFNNENSVNILNLTTQSTGAEIKEVFTDSFGEVVLPHTGDIFNVYQNSDVTNSGIVESMVEDVAGVRLVVNMSNFEDNLIHRVFYNLNYNPSQGLDSLNITNKIENIINPSKIDETAMDDLLRRVTANENELKGVNVVLDRIIGE